MNIKNKILILLVMLTCGFGAAWAEQHVTVATTQNGTVTVDKPAATASETVTITVTPAAGFQIAKSDIVAEAIIDPGSSHAPVFSTDGPTVGLLIELQGDDPANLQDERTYTFVMPDEPYSVLITSTFTSSTAYNITILESENGSVTADKSQACESDLVTLTATPDNGYELYHYVVRRMSDDALVRVNDDGTFTMPASDVTVRGVFRTKPEQLYIAFSNDLDNPIAMTYNENERSYSIALTVTDGMQFKFVDQNGDWYGPNGGTSNYAVNRNWSTDIGMWKSEDNSYYQISLAEASLELTVTVSAQKQLTVTGWNYYVTIKDGIENGTVTVDKNVVKAGETVAITATPAQGYIFNRYVVTQGINEYPVTVNADGTFIMPKGDVTVSAKFYLWGDVNLDGKVDVEDMNIIINIMLETDQAENYDGRANLNGDDKVDIEDMNAVINIMLATRSGIRAD